MAKYLSPVNTLALSAIFFVGHVQATVLPEDRTDILYHGYDGGGVKIDGPSVLVRKSIGKSVSVSANYYVDSISGASIDVETHASRYSEERTEKSLGVDYLIDRTIISVGATSSEENDYQAKTGYISISQDFFGDLSNLTIGYAQGDDDIFKTGDDTFAAEAKRRNYRLSWSQILTKSWIAAIRFEGVNDEGYLNNPYRFVVADNTGGCRHPDSADMGALGYCRRTEVYPTTRASAAVSLSSSYYLPWRAALHGEYRAFNDSWGIRASNIAIGYTLPLTEHLIFDAGFRYYKQTEADFFSNFLERDDQFDIVGRDKELSQMNSTTLELGVSYEFPLKKISFLDKGSINATFNHINFEYENYTDLRVRENPDSIVERGEEPLYSFNATVMRIFFVLWY